MPWPGRYFLPDQPLHVIQRGNNRDAIFFCDEDYERYRAWLAEAAGEYGCAIHADAPILFDRKPTTVTM